MTDEISSKLHPWITELVTAISGLHIQQVQYLADACHKDNCILLSSPGQLQRYLHISTTDAVNLSHRLRSIIEQPEITARDLGIALSTILSSKADIQERTEYVEVVCTAPSLFGIPLRATYATLLQMVREAEQEILVVGYLFTEGSRAVVESLASVSREKSMNVTFIGNRMQEYTGVLRRMWPASDPAPEIFSWEPESDNDMAALHAKLLICDRLSALITSANFSYQGLHSNIEIGIRVTSPAIGKLTEFIQAMISVGEIKQICW